jgi:hypothetical protein
MSYLCLLTREELLWFLYVYHTCSDISWGWGEGGLPRISYGKKIEMKKGAQEEASQFATEMITLRPVTAYRKIQCSTLYISLDFRFNSEPQPQGAALFSLLTLEEHLNEYFLHNCTPKERSRSQSRISFPSGATSTVHI